MIKILIKIFLIGFQKHETNCLLHSSNFLINFEANGKLFCHLVSPFRRGIKEFLDFILFRWKHFGIGLLYHLLNNARKFKPLSFPEDYFPVLEYQ